MAKWIDRDWSDEEKMDYLHRHAFLIEYEFGELLGVSPFPTMDCTARPKGDRALSDS